MFQRRMLSPTQFRLWTRFSLHYIAICNRAIFAASLFFVSPPFLIRFVTRGFCLSPLQLRIVATYLLIRLRLSRLVYTISSALKGLTSCLITSVRLCFMLQLQLISIESKPEALINLC
jgi:hypothetical protein